MKRPLLIAALLIAVGCQSDKGSLFYRKPGRADDPMLSIEEQERRGRERLSNVEDNGDLTPKVYIDRPGTTGR